MEPPEQLAHESVEIEIALTNLQSDLPRPVVERFVNPRLRQIRSIERIAGARTLQLERQPLARPQALEERRVTGGQLPAA